MLQTLWNKVFTPMAVPARRPVRAQLSLEDLEERAVPSTTSCKPKVKHDCHCARERCAPVKVCHCEKKEKDCKCKGNKPPVARDDCFKTVQSLPVSGNVLN